MLTAEEIAGITIFTGLSLDVCDRLARVAADIRLAPGEFAVHAQDKRALFAVLEGRLETVNTVDGILRVVGGRGPGELVGEVPIALGTTFPFGVRSSHLPDAARGRGLPRRCRQAPKVGERLGTLARERIGYPQGITADTPRHGRSWSASVGILPQPAPPFSRPKPGHVPLITPDAPDGELVWGDPRRPTTTSP